MVISLMRVADALDREPGCTRDAVSRATLEGKPASEGVSLAGEAPTLAETLAPVFGEGSGPGGRATVADRVTAVWPRLAERARVHGAPWRMTPGSGQRKIVAERFSDGASEDDLLRAVDGHVRKCKNMEDGGLPHLTATTIYRLQNFDANVQNGWPEVEKVEPADIRRQETLDFLNKYAGGQENGKD